MIELIKKSQKIQIIEYKAHNKGICCDITVSLVFALDHIELFAMHDNYSDGNFKYSLIDMDEDDFKAWGTWQITSLNDASAIYLLTQLNSYFYNVWKDAVYICKLEK